MPTGLKNEPSTLVLAILLAALPVRSSADSTLVFSEIMYHPAGNEAELEWLELHNQMGVDMDVSRWSLSGGIDFEFPSGTIVPGGGFLVVAVSPAALSAATGFSGALGPFAGRLSNSGETIELRNNNFRLMDSVRYRDEGDWPVAADGSGHSLAKVDLDTASAPARSWARSLRVGGTPGAANFTGGEEEPTVFPPGLVSCWSFDETGATALDAVGGNHGILGPGAVRLGGIVGSGAVSFDNTTDAYISVGSGVGGNFSTTQGITIEALIRPQWSGATLDSDDIFRKEDGPNRIVLAFQNDANEANRDVAIVPVQQPVLSFGINVGGTYSELDMPLDGEDDRPSLAALEDGQAHHVAATYRSDTGLKSIYVDGVLVFSAGLGTGRLISSGGGTTAYIGNMSGRAEPFSGVIDEVAFWNVALSAGEVAAHHAAAAAGLDYFASGGWETGVPPSSFSEAFATAEEPWIEIANHGAADLDLTGFSIKSLGAAAGEGEFVFGASTLPAGGYLVLTQSELGFALLPGNKLFLYVPGGDLVADAMELKDGLRGRLTEASGKPTGPWLYPSEPTPGGANEFSFQGDVVLNEIMYHPRGLGAVPPVVDETVLLAIDASWKYDASGTDRGTAWRAPGYADSSWPSGAALFYNETADLPAAKKTLIDLGPTTYYFRTTFQFQGDPADVALALRTVLDDGAVFYLNGVDVLRTNMPSGGVTASTLASTGVGEATFTGPFEIPADGLVSGVNHLAVEVHQGSVGSSDVVFGAELVASVTVSPGTASSEPPGSWVELHNRGASAVNLTGWKLSGGVSFAFEEGTVLGPGQFLVVAEDEDYLIALDPSIPLAGSFQGRLSRGGEKLVLEDAWGNPADEVAYLDDFPWSEFADGGGASLELRDPRADNSSSFAWAASDESVRSTWKTYTYRQVAADPYGPAQWNEFIVGLLDAGEVLLDDLSVVESPDTAPLELLQNGSFESGAAHWRLLGNHSHGEVITDPDNAGNKVLRLVATGPTEHMHNHAETTLSGNRATANGRTYQVSFKARWIVGSNALNARLYFNRAARTTLIDVPELHGTPGKRNSRFETNMGPTFSGLRHAPPVPPAGEAIAVSVQAADPDDVQAVTLWWSVNEGAWASAPMALDGAGYAGTIPGQAAGATIQFYVEARDSLGARATCPALGRGSRALIRTEDGQAQAGAKHNLRIVMKASDITFLHTNTNVMSNDRLGATVVCDENEVFYDAGVHLKGSERGRNQPARVGFNIRFPADHLFRGVHATVAIDRSGGWAFGTTTGQDEILAKHMVLHAGGIPGAYDDLIRVIAPRSAQNGSALLQMARHGKVFLDSQWVDGSQGTVFEYELIYYPYTTITGGVEGLKLPEPDNVIGVDIQNLGEDKESYRWIFLTQNNQELDDYASLIPFCQAFSLTGDALEAAAARVMDVDEWMRTFAMMALCGIGDAYTFGNNHNLRLYPRPEDGKVVALPWDWDFTFVQSTSAGLWGNQNLSKIITRPSYQHLLYGHFADICESTYNTTYMSRWVTHYGTFAGTNYSAFLNYIGQRRSYVLSQLPASVSFAITTQDGQNFTVAESSAVLEGTGWVNVREISLVGGVGPADVSWTTVTRWKAVVPLRPGANPITLVALDSGGGVVGTDTITITSTFQPPQPQLTSISPSQGAPGSSITLLGSDFLPGVKVTFGTVAASSAEVQSSGRLVATVPDLPPGVVSVTAANAGGAASPAVSFTILPRPQVFIRGDANLDGRIDLSDAVRVLRHLFSGALLGCADAADADDRETIDITDSLRILGYLFQEGPVLPAPFPGAGADPAGSALGCVTGL